MELFDALGINGKILLAQFINFAVLVFVLWRFAYKPILKFLEDRRKKIEKGVENSELAITKLEEIAEKEKEVIIEAKKEALNLINEAKDNAEKRGQELIKKAQEEASLVMLKEKEKLNQEKIEMFKEMKNNLSELVILAVEKVIEDKMDSEKDKEIIKKALKN
ncbi:MAG: F0F1 ATP synthase subunit B [Patescibacteria group bacterium]|nr:F0F1 ATP synthase subunit B [Patescibacteria group bacterium]